MNIVKESMNRQFGCMTSGLVLVLPPIISIAVTLYLQRIIGPLGCIAIFPVMYVLSLFITICGITYLIRTFEGTGKHKKEAALEDRVRKLEQLVSKLALENELLKKSRSKGPFDTTEEKNDDPLLNAITSLKPGNVKTPHRNKGPQNINPENTKNQP